MANYSVLAVVLMSVLAAPALGEGWGPGVRFDLMPKGCRIHGVYGDGTATVDVYAGKKGRTHIVQTFAQDGLQRTTTYNAQGLMIRKDWAGGEWETFAPFSCFAVPGDCTYEYRNGDGARKVFRGKVVRRGKQMVSGGGFAGEPPFNDTTLTPGPFNEISAFREGSTRYRVTRYENCGNPEGA